MLLRRAVVAYGVLCLLLGAALALAHVTVWLVLYLLVNGVVVVGAVLFERRRYRPPIAPGGGPWRLTGERFIDPTTGRLMAVRYNPRSGQRDYVAVPPAEPKRYAERDQE